MEDRISPSTNQVELGKNTPATTTFQEQSQSSQTSASSNNNRPYNSTITTTASNTLTATGTVSSGLQKRIRYTTNRQAQESSYLHRSATVDTPGENEEFFGYNSNVILDAGSCCGKELDSDLSPISAGSQGLFIGVNNNDDKKTSNLRRHVSCGGNLLPLNIRQFQSKRGFSVTDYKISNSSRIYHKNSTPILLNQSYSSHKRPSNSMEFPNSYSHLSISDDPSDFEFQERFAKAYAAAVMEASNKSNKGLITEVPEHLYNPEAFSITHRRLENALRRSNRSNLSPYRFSGVCNSSISVNSYNGDNFFTKPLDHHRGSQYKSYHRIPSTDLHLESVTGKNSTLNISPGNLSIQQNRAGRLLTRAASWRYNKHIQRLATTFNSLLKDEKDLEKGHVIDASSPTVPFLQRSLSISDNCTNPNLEILGENSEVKKESLLKDDGTQTQNRNIWTCYLEDGRRECMTQSEEDFFQEMIHDNLFTAKEISLAAATYGFDEKILDQANDEEDNLDIRGGSTSNYLKEQFLSFFQPSDNKLAMKLFGNKNALNKEKRRLRQQGKWIIHPCSSFRFYWDLIMLLLLIANLIILPIAISFIKKPNEKHWVAFNIISDTIFLLDIAVNFRTGIITNDYVDEIILEPKKIASKYVHSWFFLDLISSIPMDYVFLIFHSDVADLGSQKQMDLINAGRSLRILRLVKLISLLRLLRLSRLVRYISQWEEFLNIASKFLGILNLVLLMLLLGHWNACLQFLIPMIKEHPVGSWTRKCRIENVSWMEQYPWALFKAMSHMLSIGYGRFPPTAIDEAWITIVSMMTGATCYALFVGHAAALIQSFDCSKRMYREKFKQVEEYMAYRKLPKLLRQRIANYYEHRYQGKMFNENTILEELSECLREQIVNYNCRALVAAVPFFKYADQDFVSDVVVKLRYEVFQPGDLIIKEGTIGSKMYFIQEGIVDIITNFDNKDGEVATSLSDGSYFGEICLLTNARRVASVRAETYCNLYSLDRVSFLEVLHNYPLMRRTMESVAAERLDKIGKDPFLISSRKDLRDDLQLVKEIVDEASSSDSGSGKTHESQSSLQRQNSEHTSSRNSFAKRLRRKKRTRNESTANENSARDQSSSIVSETSRRRSVAQMVQKIGGLRSLYQSSSTTTTDAPTTEQNKFNSPQLVVTPSDGYNFQAISNSSSTSSNLSRIMHKATSLVKKTPNSALIKKTAITHDIINEDEFSQDSVDTLNDKPEIQDNNENKN